MSAPPPLYSAAPRCRPCDMKAILTQAQTESLASMSNGMLASYPCPVGDGWHVRRADRDSS